MVGSLTPQGCGEERGLLFTEKPQERGQGPPSPFQPGFLLARLGSPSEVGSGVFAGCSSGWEHLCQVLDFGSAEGRVLIWVLILAGQDVLDILE